MALYTEELKLHNFCHDLTHSYIKGTFANSVEPDHTIRVYTVCSYIGKFQ